MNAIETMQVELTREPVRDVAAFSTWRLMLWQVKKEVWEHRSLWIAPAATVGLAFAMWLWAIIREAIRGSSNTLYGDPLLTGVWAVSSVLVGIIMFFVTVQFCLDALYGERRERTVLFWKSLPVSDTVTVLSKFAVPAVVAPAIWFAAVLVLDVLVWMTSALMLLYSHVSGAGSIHSGLFSSLALDVYSVVLLTLWYAPIYAVLLLISSFSKRMPMTWAIIPPVVLVLMERAIWHTSHVSDFLGWAFGGVFHLAWSGGNHVYVVDVSQRFEMLTPGRFFAAPHLWIGLALTAALLLFAARVRRHQVSN